MSSVEQGLQAAVESDGPLTPDAVATLKAGGKRMRPMLVLLCAGPGGVSEAVPRAVAVEMIHMASLVHDDVLDRAPLRRGKPTVFAESGRERATALGDRLFATAFSTLAENGDGLAISELSDTAVDLARGELMQRRGAFDLSLPEQDYLERCRLKTGRLFAAACVLGRSTVSQGESGVMADFGHRIGLAFQMLDDVLDISGPVERTGKARGTDLLDGTVTLPLIAAIAVEPGLADTDLHGLDEYSAVTLCDAIAATGVLEAVRERAMDLIAQAKSGIAEASLEEEQLRLLELIADGVVLRYS
ncbi:MAG: polyprenyl synthetase family protein [Solirubrobacterales bacterium]